MKQFTNSYEPQNHAAIPCPIREAAKVWAVLTEEGSGATQEERDAAQDAYRAAKKAAGIDEIWTPARVPAKKPPRPVFNTEAQRTAAKKARNQRYGRQTDDRRRQATKENQAKEAAG